MKIARRSSVLAAFSLLVSAGLAQVAGEGQEEPPTAEEIADAGRRFQQSCMGCHLPPDLSFAVDRAWLGQVKDTA